MVKLSKIITFLFTFSALCTQHSTLLPVTAGNSQDASQPESAQTVQSIEQFSASVTTGNSHQIVGVYVENKLAFPIVQQPTGNAAFVSTQSDVVTQFAMATQYGSVGLVAHNNLAGAKFSDLKVGDRAILIYGDGSKQTYEIKEIDEYQALSPYSPYSDFIDLSNPGTKLGSNDLFMKIYNPDNRLILQTCIAKEGVDSWGRLFVVAEPVKEYAFYYHLSSN